LDAPIESLPGAGPVTAARLATRGLVHVRDLLYFFPRSYEDYRQTYALADLAQLPLGASVVVQGTVVRVHKFFRRLLDVYLEEDGVRLRARWFRSNAGMAQSYVRGQRVALAGNLRRTAAGDAELVHPSNVTASLAETGVVGIRPHYPVVEKIPARTVEKVVAAALTVALQGMVDPLPEEMRQPMGLPPLLAALTLVHRPPSSLTKTEFEQLMTGSLPAQRRFAFEELLVLQLVLAQERRCTRMQPGWRCRDDGRQGLSERTAEVQAEAQAEVQAEVKAALPFALTGAQEQAIHAIVDKLGGEVPMQCLLQGDVGSGKTAVAFAAAVQVVRAGGQVLFMAPTAVLAEQHSRTLAVWGRSLGLRTRLLHAGLPSAAKQQVLAGAANGDVDVIVGTHALLEERLLLHDLGLAIVDEQHRFGVRQRARLRRRGQDESGWQIGSGERMVPHLLVLSATPIPRTLALTLYGDLDLVTLADLPPGRKPVATHVGTSAADRAAAYLAVKAAVATGGQAFVVCPAIAEASAATRKPLSVLSWARKLRTTLAPARIGVLHGQLASEAQRTILDAFRDRALDVLVATTVLEVGVDVPNASVMVIEDADFFGLAQLHQLRGRVGRGEVQATCHLLTTTDDADALDRLRVLADVHDGFRIAEEDLRRRGAGDVQGTRQTGTPDLRFADLATYGALVELARAQAESLLAGDPDLSLPGHDQLHRLVAERWQQQRPVAEEAG